MAMAREHLRQPSASKAMESSHPPAVILSAIAASAIQISARVPRSADSWCR